MSLVSFTKVAFPVSLLLDEYGIEDDDIIELAFADDFMYDGDGAVTRAYYEDLFRRFGYNYLRR